MKNDQSCLCATCGEAFDMGNLDEVVFHETHVPKTDIPYTGSVRIPSLGDTAADVLKNALDYKCAGFILKFDVVGDGCWYWDKGESRFRKLTWIGRIPVSDPVSVGFDGWLLNQIASGFVTIRVESPGQSPSYSLELHRATARKISLE
jgi:hypothetical protein